MKENLQDTELDNLDKRNIQLGYMLKRLSQNIDIDRIIGLNVCSLEESSIGNTFIGYLQEQARCFIALDISKIYEKQKNTYKLNSISGVISAIPDYVKTEDKISPINEFFEKHDIQTSKSDDLKTILLCALEQIEDKYKEELCRLKKFRNTYIAHSDITFNGTELASPYDYEALLKFAYDFYCLISKHFIDVEPGFLRAKVGGDFSRVMKKHGISEPIIFFEQRERLENRTSKCDKSS